MSNTNESESPCACWPSRMCDRSAECAKVHREDRMVVLERNDEGRATVWCDPEIADIVGALNAGGLRTVASCSGHGVVAGCISLADGRELLIARNAGERDHMLSVFPTDINGMPRGSRHCEEPAASLVEQKDRRIAELEVHIVRLGDECQKAEQVYAHLKMWPLLDELRAALSELRAVKGEV